MIGLLLKTLHLVFLVTWFAGLFYLPRLFVYHAEAEDRISLDRFKTMESRLYRIIMTPSAVLTLVFGAGLLAISWSQYINALWFWCKLVLVVVLYGYHGFCGRVIRRFAADEKPFSSRFFRWFNEIPTLLLIFTVALAVFRPQ